MSNTETRTESRVMRYDDLVRRVAAHHRHRGEQADFWLMRGGAIVASYRVRDQASSTWKDLLPTGVSAERYQATVQRLAPILFPGEDLVIRAVARGDRDVTIEVRTRAPGEAGQAGPAA